VTSHSAARTQTAVAVRQPASTESLATLTASHPAVEQAYDLEIARLHEIVKQRSAQLDPTTVVILEKNLKVIDDAIAQCKEALRSDPNSRFLIESLNDALESKVLLLRKAATLPTKA
jgi:hypothetical protein